MGFFARLFGAKSRRRASALEFGHGLVEAVIEQTRVLNQGLDDIGCLGRVPGIKDSLQYILALSVFKLAPLDQVLDDMPMAQMKSVRAVVRSGFAQKFGLTPEGVRLLDIQLSTYARAVRTGNIVALGQLATQAVGLNDDADAELLLVHSYTGALSDWPTTISEYDIV